jgi:hypothetical protein
MRWSGPAAHVGKKQNTEFRWGNLKERENWEDAGVD